ncbi:alpha-hydroxy acid oxidase [Jannaschia aquimarina]|uniref:LldD_2 protein n=1 Tax=Jannaschia aquimarina TaxID=935700 RepID=A0A0D1EEE7_9RHOB|nr:alpha-hydroxy acid oxidase [Jannaschia aquimarina]KIT14265.1 L-lactate dehydrogenase [Jannaschia aquimarina]SNS49545.1 L-lactate dehydrogenase (cytochrome) [Jannaschia aquimarina]
MPDLDLSHPAISDLRASARRRLPKFAFEYVDSGTGTEGGVRMNHAGLDAVRFQPAILRGPLEFDLSARAFDDHPLPFGIAPVGYAGLIWPDAERHLARAAVRHGIPYGQSTVATVDPEATGPIAGDLGWFQHYPVNDAGIRRDMLRRIAASGWKVLVVTVDVPGESRRERQRRANISMPPIITPGMVRDMILNPAWSIGHARVGKGRKPRMVFPESYLKDLSGADAFVHAGRLIRGYPDDAYIAALREEWDGPLVVKGVQEGADAERLLKLGVDGIWVSNHSGRQFEGGPAAIENLREVAAAVAGRARVFYCSGLRGGLDILRAYALGADFVFLGKAWYFALAALGPKGVDHLVHILSDDMRSNMAQLGITRPQDAATRLLGSQASTARSEG